MAYACCMHAAARAAADVSWKTAAALYTLVHACLGQFAVQVPIAVLMCHASSQHASSVCAMPLDNSAAALLGRMTSNMKGAATGKRLGVQTSCYEHDGHGAF